MINSNSPWYLRRFVPITVAVMLALLTSFIQQGIALAFGLPWEWARVWQDATGYLFISVVLVGVVELMERRREAHTASAQLSTGLSFSVGTYLATIGQIRDTSKAVDVERHQADTTSELLVLRDEALAQEAMLREGYAKATKTKPASTAILHLCVLALAAGTFSAPTKRRARQRLISGCVAELQRAAAALADSDAEIQQRVLQAAARVSVSYEATEASIIECMRSRRVAHKAEAATIKSILDSIDEALFIDPLRAFAAGVRLLQDAVIEQKDSISEFDVAEAFWTFGVPIMALADEAEALASCDAALAALASEIDANVSK
ncbi:hypothetical protein WJX64_06905 [Leifsonia sp. YIM 134122]|uniref:Uncharacterized protein n=1 Tax=Leifsonia stereocauli TaxID=3134136 RepID=A0ABU9W2Q8_9MICO